MFFENLTGAQPQALPTPGFDQFIAKAKICSPFRLQSKDEPQAAKCNCNSHVFYILPVTPLRTIDLGGRKISASLFSRFCAEREVFFEGFYAPQYVHKTRRA